ncbi:Abi family protein [Listeria kieliensis]
MKPFKTHRQQLTILRSRSLNTGNGSHSMRYLEEENYYNVINGYKGLFLKKDDDGRSFEPEEYIDGAHIDEIFCLFKLDQGLRNIYVEYLLKFESNLKSFIAYRFAEKFKEPNAYLDLNNYSKDSRKIKAVLKTISILSNTISQQVSKKSKNSIDHYVDKHGGVPIWVLVNYITIGNVSYFYSVLDDSLAENIAKDFNTKYNRERKKQQSLLMQRKELESIIKIVNIMRNVCAHEERFYSKKAKDNRIAYFANFFDIDQELLRQGSLFTLTILLRAVLSKKDSQALHRELRDIFKQYKNCFASVKIESILKIMGFPANWRLYMEPI